jgi:hypothetical protein
MVSQKIELFAFDVIPACPESFLFNDYAAIRFPTSGNDDFLRMHHNWGYILFRFELLEPRALHQLVKVLKRKKLRRNKNPRP